ncbi:MAG TPA: peptidoglycan DD-metalloendopeptidase family protein [Gammaproteobacteria bacterium]|nr:peptidoglycan DD-metalloendopeptidase family protein [Gammaproteobacteria bacterium]
MRLLVALLAFLSSASIAADPFPVDEPIPGGVAVVKLPVEGKTVPRAEMDGHRLLVIARDGAWYALAGLPLDIAPGDKTLDVETDAAEALQVKFQVAPKDYPTQSLTIANPELVNPTPAQLKRAEREQKHLDKVVNGWRKTARPGVTFIWPASGPETSAFGVRRVLNGEAKSPHAGIDIGAPLGTPLHAPADAEVADVGHYFYCGKTLTLDMGQGLYSVFCHMSIIKVGPGQKVKQGQYVGRIGMTGRATGPNLHWTVRLNGAAVDPHVFLGTHAPAPRASTAIAPAKPASSIPPSAATNAAPAPASH